jgi:hypothetical protein
MLIDQFRPNALKLLGERIASLPDNVNFYLLIDGVFVPGIRRTQPFEANDVQLLFEFLPGCTDEVRDVSPFLCLMRKKDVKLSSQLRAVLLPCSGFPMVSAIASEEGLDKLAQRLAAWSIIENDGQHFNFRYPDTRRLPGLYGALRQDQRAQLCGPMSFWSHIGRDGGWFDLEIAKTDRDIASCPVLDDEQFGLMVGDSAADEVLFRLTYSGFVVADLPSVLHEKISAALRAAVDTGMTDALCDEWCKFCLKNCDGPATADGAARWRSTRASA